MHQKILENSSIIWLENYLLTAIALRVVIGISFSFTWILFRLLLWEFRWPILWELFWQFIKKFIFSNFLDTFSEVSLEITLGISLAIISKNSTIILSTILAISL